MRDILRLVLVLTIIAAGAGLVLSLVEGVTRGPIAEQRRQQTLKALKAVMPPVDNAPDADTVILPIGKDRKGREIDRTFYFGRQGEELVALAFKVVSADGYSGEIEIMVGIRPDGAVYGIEILRHAETPGLGDKIAAGWFREQFSGQTLESVDWRVKKDGGDFDQLTGATISPRAVVSAIRQGLEFYREHRPQILAGAEERK